MSALTVQDLAPRFVRFGSFELDLITQELRRNGVRVRLQYKPFQVLQFLLERGGDIVSREELERRLWPADTHVDFETSLNTAVNRLRQALGDTAENPRFVETLARRGYRFIAPVQWAEGADNAPTAAQAGLLAQQRSPWLRKLLLIAGLVVLLTVAMLVWRSTRIHSNSSPTPVGATGASPLPGNTC
jgi:DNA-binding winged helix-turn-helix (wHTH) protein